MRNTRNKNSDMSDEWFGKTLRKKPRIGVLHTKREEKPMKRIILQDEDVMDAMQEIHDYLDGEYDDF